MKTRITLLLGLGMLLSQFTLAQGKYGATPEDSTKCVENISLYSEYYKQEAYKDAKPFLVDAIEICPKSSKNLYIKGSVIFKKLLKENKGNDAVYAGLLDTLMWIYDQRAEHFGDKGYVLGRKGTDMLRYGGVKKSLDAYNTLKEGFELSQNETEAGALAAYYQAAYYSVAQKQLDKEVLLELYPQLNGVLAHNLKNNGQLSKAEKQAAGQIDEIFSKVASCEDLVAIYTPKFEANKQDTATLLQIIALFEKRGCTDEDLFLQASIEADKSMPSGLSKVGIGIGLMKKERYSEAAGFLEDAAEMAQAPEVKKKAYLYLAKANLARKSYAATKSAALNLLKLDPENGEAYMLIGDAYFYGSSTVGDNECENKGGVWAAVAKYQRAKSLDAELAEQVNKRLGQLAARYPTKEDCFFYNILDGQTYTVGGWINETVTVKTNN